MALLIRIPESPRWLFSVNRKEKADAILQSTIGADAATKELDDMSNAALKHSVSKISVFSKSIRLPLFIGITLAILQQFCGINAIIYYGSTIFESAGIAKGNALMFQVIIGTINLLFTFVAIRYADKFGRRFLLLTGLSGIVLSLVL